MTKKYLIDGRFLVEDTQEGDIDDVLKILNKKATVDNLESWESNEQMEKYDASVFISKARYYFSLNPPDLVQSGEKLWYAAVYAVKYLYLNSGGVNLKSHNSLKFFVRFALKHASLPDSMFWYLHDSWIKAEKMHRDVYGSSNYCARDYAQIIIDVEIFVRELEAFDGKNLWLEFERAFISGSDPEVVVTKEEHSINLGGYHFKSKYAVFV